MNVDNLGRCILETSDVLEYLYRDGKIEDVNANNSTLEKFNQTVQHLKQYDTVEPVKPVDDVQQFDQQQQQNWYMPDTYKQLDVEQYVMNLVQTEQEQKRVTEELKLYKKFNLYTVLQYLIYLVDLMRKNNIVWGVGRGSSVSSYVLFLIGVHKVNSIEFDLDINEFLR